MRNLGGGFPHRTSRRIIISALGGSLVHCSLRLDGAIAEPIVCNRCGKLFAEITKSEAAIQRRKSELLQESSSDCDELAAIERALHVLVQLREIEQKK